MLTQCNNLAYFIKFSEALKNNAVLANRYFSSFFANNNGDLNILIDGKPD